LYDGFTALDAVGPYEVLSRLPGASVRFVAERPGPVRTETGALALIADDALDDVPAPEVVMVPGGFGSRALLDGGPMVDWVRAARIAGEGIAQAIQLGIEYDPDPPFATGSVATAPPELVDLVRARASELA